MHIYSNTVQKSRTARSDKNTNSCPKTFSKTVTWYIFYHTSKILQTNENSLFNAIPKPYKDVKFTVDGSAWEVFAAVKCYWPCLLL